MFFATGGKMFSATCGKMFSATGGTVFSATGGIMFSATGGKLFSATGGKMFSADGGNNNMFTVGTQLTAAGMNSHTMFVGCPLLDDSQKVINTMKSCWVSGRDIQH